MSILQLCAAAFSTFSLFGTKSPFFGRDGGGRNRRTLSIWDKIKDTGKITDAKDYVMTLAKEQLSQVGINLSDEMIDEIRRAAVLEWESSIKQLENEIVIKKEEVPELNKGEIEAKTVEL